MLRTVGRSSASSLRNVATGRRPRIQPAWLNCHFCNVQECAAYRPCFRTTPAEQQARAGRTAVVGRREPFARGSLYLLSPYEAVHALWRMWRLAMVPYLACKGCHVHPGSVEAGQPELFNGYPTNRRSIALV